MAETLQPVKLPSKKWVDVYFETGIQIGTQIIIQNIGAGNARLVESVTEPSKQDGFNRLTPDLFLVSGSNPVGVWAFAHKGTQLQVEVA